MEGCTLHVVATRQQAVEVIITQCVFTEQLLCVQVIYALPPAPRAVLKREKSQNTQQRDDNETASHIIHGTVYHMVSSPPLDKKGGDACDTLKLVYTTSSIIVLVYCNMFTPVG